MKTFFIIMAVLSFIVYLIFLVTAMWSYSKKDYPTAFWNMLWAILMTVIVHSY